VYVAIGSYNIVYVCQSGWNDCTEVQVIREGDDEDKGSHSALPLIGEDGCEEQTGCWDGRGG